MPYALSPGERRRNYFWAVLDGFVDSTLAPPIAALVPDPDEKPNLKWSPNLAHFKIDITNAVKKALPRPELQREFWRLAVRRAYGLTSPDDPQHSKVVNTVINRCAKIFSERQLKPSQYFGGAA